MTWQQFANRRQYAITCPENCSPARWRAMTRQWDNNPIESFFDWVMPYDEVSAAKYAYSLRFQKKL